MKVLVDFDKVSGWLPFRLSTHMGQRSSIYFHLSIQWMEWPTLSCVDFILLTLQLAGFIFIYLNVGEQSHKAIAVNQQLQQR